MSQVCISQTAIDLQAFRKQLQDESCGALVLFEGWIRNHIEGRAVQRLAYEVYEPLAVKEGAVIMREALQRYDITRAAAIHRSGELALSDVAVVVGVSSSHRGAAFDACRYIIDQAKVRLPIWKKEHYTSGKSEWVNCQRCSHGA